MREDIIQRWRINPGCWVEIRFHGMPTWRGIRLMVARLMLMLPPVGARVYAAQRDKEKA